MKRHLFIVLISIILLLSGCSNSQVKIRSLAENFRAALKDGDFGSVYDHASDYLQRNLSREEFIDRLNKLKREMQKIDADMSWKEDEEFESNLNNVLNEKFDESITWDLYAARRILGKGKQNVEITIIWMQKPGIEPQLLSFDAYSYLDTENPVQLSSFRN